LQGSLGRSSSKLPLSGLSVRVSSEPDVLKANRAALNGEVNFGPRAGAQGQIAYIIDQGENQTLFLNQRAVIATGAPTPSGATAAGALPPVMGTDGLMYFTLITDRGSELCAYDGRQVYHYLKSGDTLLGDDRPIDMIWLGTTTQQTNRLGQLSFVVGYADKSAAIVLGVPA
jgi:hypothetical protein